MTTTLWDKTTGKEVRVKKAIKVAAMIESGDFSVEKPEPQSDKEVSKMTVAELKVKAQELGVEIEDGALKADILAAVEANLAESADAE